MRVYTIIGSLVLLLCLLVGCSERSTGPGQGVNIELTAQLESRAFVQQVDQLWLTVSAPDMETIEEIQFLQDSGAVFELQVPVGRNRTFLLQAVETSPTGGEPREIYRGTAVADVLPGVINPVVIRMLPSLPLVRLVPLRFEGPSGESVRLELQVFNMDKLQDLRVQFTYDNTILSPADANSAPWLPAGTQFESGRANLDLYAYEMHFYNPNGSIVSPDNPTLAEVFFTTNATTTNMLFTSVPFFDVNAYNADSVLVPDSSIYLEFTNIVLLPLTDGPVTFADSNLQNYIVRNNELNNNPPQLSDLLTITFLNAPDQGFADLSGMENLLNLTTLYLDFNNISNVEPLVPLRNLRQLTLNSNLVDNQTMQQISFMDYLEALSLNDNSISDISVVRNLRNLGALSLANNSIVFIDALRDLTELYSLNLDSNAITNIAPLVQNPGLAGFDNVSLVGNPLDDVSINTYIPQLTERGVIVNY